MTLSIQQLPRDILIEIFRRLPPEELVDTVARVCRLFEQIAHESTLWTVCARKYQIAPSFQAFQRYYNFYRTNGFTRTPTITETPRLNNDFVPGPLPAPCAPSSLCVRGWWQRKGNYHFEISYEGRQLGQWDIARPPSLWCSVQLVGHRAVRVLMEHQVIDYRW